MNGFAMDEIDRMLNRASVGGVRGGVRPQPSITRNFPSRGRAGAGGRPPKRTNETVNRGRQNAARNNLELNDLRTYGGEEEQDWDGLLAMHLAQDLSPGATMDRDLGLGAMTDGDLGLGQVRTQGGSDVGGFGNHFMGDLGKI